MDDHWTEVSCVSLARQTGLSLRQVQYNLPKYFGARTDGSGSLMSIRLSDLKRFRKAGRLAGAGIPINNASKIAVMMGDSNTVVISPSNVRITLED